MLSRKGADARRTPASPISASAPGRTRHRPPATASGRRWTFQPRYVLDASGRDTFLATRMRVKVMNKYNNTAAIYAHFQGVERRSGELDGYISIHLAEDGWFWLIPCPATS
jgi:hypothetical protein